MTTTEKKRILVVDDDPDLLFQYQVLLKDAGFDVTDADSNEKAKALVAANEFDLAIVDLMMEELDAGFTLCYAIKKKNPAVPVIIVTAVARETGMVFDAVTQEEKSWIKADAMLPKPVRPDQLMREIHRFLKD